MKKYRKLMAWLCVCTLVISTLPLYIISAYNHPYYDDYGFSAGVHHVWKETGSLTSVLGAAFESARQTRQNWQGTYTGTLLSNLQPGLFSEELYGLANVFLLTALIGCMLFFFMTVFGWLGMRRSDCLSLGCLAVTLMIQFMPDVGEAFYWFNGGVGNVFIYSLLALAAALGLRLSRTRGRGIGLTLALAVLAVLLGGGSYGGGLFALCMSACALVWMFRRRESKRWHFATLIALFASCFLYSMSAPGNGVRADMIGYRASPVKAVVQSLYHGMGQMGEYIRLPLIAITLLMAPALYEAAKQSPYRFEHPWLAGGLMGLLFCTQLTPPLYSIASIGAGRIVNTYFICFVCGWFVYMYYLAGWAARRFPPVQECTRRRFGALALVAVCLLGMGCLSFKRSGDVLYGVQNLSGPSAALSLLTGEAAQYDREMTQREVLLNDESLPVVTLSPLTANPSVLMDDLLEMGAVYDVRPSLCAYYGKEAILLEGEVNAP